MEESRLLKIIYKKLSKMNPNVHKRIFTSSPSMKLMVNEIISILEDVTDSIAVTDSIKKGEKSYQKMEKLAVLYTKKVGVSFSSGNVSSISKIGRLRNVNKILDIIARRMKSI
jgi:hypothetical protein